MSVAVRLGGLAGSPGLHRVDAVAVGYHLCYHRGMATTWRNRIVEHGELDPESLLANPRNYRIHPQAQQEALQGVLEDVGWVDEIIVNRRTGFVVDGHLRASLALRRGIKKVPVKYIDVSEAEEMEILATIDPLAAMAVTDLEKYDELIASVETDTDAVLGLMRAQRQSDMKVVGEMLTRPDFSSTVENLGAAPDNPMKGAANGNWLYVEFYANDKTFAKMTKLLEEHMKGESKHELDPDFFAKMVKTYCGRNA